MTLETPPDVQEQLEHIARRTGRDVNDLATEALRAYVEHDEWFVKEVEAGIREADKGEFLTHEEVGARLSRFLKDG